MKYDPYWPDNILMIGAGATASLGLMQTSKLGESLYRLATAESVQLESVLADIFKGASNRLFDSVKQLLRIISGDEVCDDMYSKQRQKELRDVYDWHALKQIIKRCPVNQYGHINIQDAYNLVDMHTQSGHGFSVDGEQIRPERMAAARNTMNMLTVMIHAQGYQTMLLEKKDLYEQYYGFAKLLAESMGTEGLDKEKNYALNNREFYLFSYAVISMNWDPIFLWLIFNAHKEWNENHPPYIGDPPSSMKLFHDMAHFMAVRSIDSSKPEAWFPMNETAVQRLNDPEHATGRRVRIGKFYFPHGCHGFRECPTCGKLTFYLGDQWGVESVSLFPPQLIKELAYENSARSLEEQHAQTNGKLDAVQCSHCGEITEAHHSPIVMQTNFKGNHAPFIEEIQRDMKVAISKAKHFILFGYSFPEDDFVYRSIFAARKRREPEPKCSIVNYDKNAPNQWMVGEELKKFMYDYPNVELSKISFRMAELFGSENIRVYGGGIPNVFLTNERADAKKVNDMMCWPL